METSVEFDVAKLKQDVASKGWLPEDLAKAAGVSPMTVSRVFRGQRHNPRTWQRLAKALGFSVRRYVGVN